MKIQLALLAILLVAGPVSAKTLRCDILENTSVVSSMKVETALGKKVAIGSTRLARGYVTERENGAFVVEGFLPEYEARIYAQGTIRASNDQVIATLWGRDSLIELVCVPFGSH